MVDVVNIIRLILCSLDYFIQSNNRSKFSTMDFLDFFAYGVYLD